MAEAKPVLPKPPPPPIRKTVVLKAREALTAKQALDAAKGKASPPLPYSKVRLRGLTGTMELSETVELNGCVGVVLPAILADVQPEPNTLQIRIDTDDEEPDVAVYYHQCEPLEGSNNVLASLNAEEQSLLKRIDSQVRGEAGRKMIKMKTEKSFAEKVPPKTGLNLADVQQKPHPPYSKVRLRGLKNAAEKNGRVGIVLPPILAEVQDEPDTLQVRIDTDVDAEDICVFGHQLEPLEGPRNVLASLSSEDQTLLKKIESLVREEAAQELKKKSLEALASGSSGKKPGPKAAPKPSLTAPKPPLTAPKPPLTAPRPPKAVPKSSIFSSSIVTRATPKPSALGPPPTRAAPPAPPPNSKKQRRE